jgi:hypothetical protein
MKFNNALSRAEITSFAVIATLAFTCAGAGQVASTAWRATPERSVSTGVQLVDASDDAAQQQQQMNDEQQMNASEQQAEEQNEVAQQEAQQAEQQGQLVEQQASQ